MAAFSQRGLLLRVTLSLVTYTRPTECAVIVGPLLPWSDPLGPSKRSASHSLRVTNPVTWQGSKVSGVHNRPQLLSYQKRGRLSRTRRLTGAEPVFGEEGSGGGALQEDQEAIGGFFVFAGGDGGSLLDDGAMPGVRDHVGVFAA